MTSSVYTTLVPVFLRFRLRMRHSLDFAQDSLISVRQLADDRVPINSINAFIQLKKSISYVIQKSQIPVDNLTKSAMRFITTLIKHNGKYMIKFPRKFSRVIGLRSDDKYTVSLTPDKSILIKFIRPLSPLNPS